ncbi:MAG TPA: class I adenylate-forming enzyme family protein [Acidimicrobiales bacterium]|nr:class I adenylate-forming enzyme family protein [Acidimicrobiales bacterium]
MTRQIVVEAVRGVPMRVFAERPRSLVEVADIVRVRTAREFIVCGERRVTDHELLGDAARVAANLRARGLERGERVAILAANSIEWATAFWGVVLAGGVVAALNGWWKGGEILYALGHCAPRFLIADAPRLERLITDATPDQPAALDAVFVVDGTESVSAPALPSGAKVESFTQLLDDAAGFSPESSAEDDPVAIFYTSGTTGRPKGAIATHRSWIAAVQCLRHLAEQAVAGGLASGGSDDREPEATLATLPLFHVSGCQSTLVSNLVAGTRTILLDGRFDPERVLALIEAEGITRWSAVPTMVSRVCRHPDRDRFDLGSMRTVSYGGSPAPPELPGLVRATFPNVRSVANAYGLTESGTIIAVNSGADFDRRPDSVGRPFPLIEVRIGDDAPPGAVGEIQLRGPMIMPGYWDDPGASAEILSRDGWLSTGDLGHLDADGYLYVTDRAKDMIIRGGENVYPAEIEQRLGEHPDVIEAAVVGLPDPDLGESVKAIVRLVPGSTVSDEELSAFVGDALAAFKVPVVWARTAEPLPRNATGKLLKNVLRGVGDGAFDEVL